RRGPAPAAHDDGVPAVRRVRRARRDLRHRADRDRAGVPGAGARGRRRHPRARLHPLPAAHRCHLLRRGRRRHARQQRRGDRQGRLPHAGGAPPPGGARQHAELLLPRHRRPGGVRPARAPLPRPRGRRAERGGDHRRDPAGRHVRLVVVGWPGSVSGPEPASSCYLLQADRPDGGTTSVLVDLGSGAFGQLLRYVAPEQLDAVLLSHLHADHVVDLAALEVYLRYAPGGPFDAVDVWGPDGTDARIEQLSGEPSSGAEVFRTHAWVDREPVRVGPFEIVPTTVLHPVPAFALRITGPAENGQGTRTLVFTGDTDACDGVLAAAHG